eukprot:TRINITY_DN9436_c0_g2_i5.p1 TRINITY_DN9436_c0_g2~~TRINITY_DN9436_c0_g2_i5.p1  ORF type:complete len:484 (+),score=48.56 TRINITY_DN9436_c0_g2_i5:84-1535(+)
MDTETVPRYSKLALIDVLRTLGPLGSVSRKLCSAVLDGHIEVIDRFLSGPIVDPEQCNVILVAAAAAGHVDILDRLLAAPGVDVTAKLYDALSTAVKHAHFDVVDRLLAIPGTDAHEALIFAIENGQFAMVERLLAVPGVDVAAQDNLALLTAIRHGHIALVDRFLAIPGVDAAAHDNAAIIEAAQCGDLTILDRLLRVKGVNPRAQNNAALIAAAKYGHLSIVDRLLSIRGVDATAQNNQALVFAASNHHVSVFNRLLSVPGVDVAAQDHQILLSALRFGNVEIISRLLAFPSVQTTLCQNHSELVVVAVKKYVEQMQQLAVASLDLQRIVSVRMIDRRAMVVQLICAVPGVDLGPAILWAAKLGTWAVLELLLNYPTAARAVNLDPSVTNSPLTRHLHAMDLYRQQPEELYRKFLFAEEISEAYQVAYGVVREEQEGFVGLAELVCEKMVLTSGLAHWTVHVHRLLRKELNKLASIAEIGK